MSSPVASEIRAPVPYRNSSSARSRSTRGSAASVDPAASSTRSTASRAMALGSRLAAVGGATWRAGSASASRSPTANACSPRTATTARPTELTASGGCSSSPTASAAAELGHVQLGHVGQRAPAAPAQEGGVPAQVPLVGPHGVVGQPALHDQVLQVPPHPVTHADHTRIVARPGASPLGPRQTRPPSDAARARAPGAPVSRPALRASCCYPHGPAHDHGNCCSRGNFFGT